MARSGGVYSYRTADGVRWRFVYRRSDGGQTTKRGFTSERAACNARRRLVEQVERGEVRHTKETFGAYWERWLSRRRPYLKPGTWAGYEVAGRRRLLPAFGDRSLGALSVEGFGISSPTWPRPVEAGEMAAKTVNNALGTLVVCLNGAVEDGLIASNPALRVDRLPPAHIERDYLRLDEIPRYLEACSDVYLPLAELLIGSGLRISEALGLRLGDLELEPTGGVIIALARGSRNRWVRRNRTGSDRSRSGRGCRRSCEITSLGARSMLSATAPRRSCSSCQSGDSGARPGARQARALVSHSIATPCRGLAQAGA